MITTQIRVNYFHFSSHLVFSTFFLQQAEEAAATKNNHKKWINRKIVLIKFSELYISCWLIKAKIMSLKF